MIVKRSITEKLRKKFQISFLEVSNESYMHGVPDNSETHFKITIVSNDFEGKKLIFRQRMINKLLAKELSGPVHALAQHAYTEEEWLVKLGRAPASPGCLGGSAK